MVNEKELSLLKKLFRSIISGGADVQRKQIHDIFVQIDLEKGELSLFNDNDEQMASTIIYAWSKPDYKSPSDVMIRTLNCTIKELEVEGFWDNDIFSQPLNITLVDKDFSTIEDLYFLDNDMVVLSEPLLRGVDEDLDKFLNDLLGDALK